MCVHVYKIHFFPYGQKHIIIKKKIRNILIKILLDAHIMPVYLIHFWTVHLCVSEQTSMSVRHKWWCVTLTLSVWISLDRTPVAVSMVTLRFLMGQEPAFVRRLLNLVRDWLSEVYTDTCGRFQTPLSYHFKRFFLKHKMKIVFTFHFCLHSLSRL